MGIHSQTRRGQLARLSGFPSQPGMASRNFPLAPGKRFSAPWAPSPLFQPHFSNPSHFQSRSRAAKLSPLKLPSGWANSTNLCSVAETQTRSHLKVLSTLKPDIPAPRAGDHSSHIFTETGKGRHQQGVQHVPEAIKATDGIVML